MALVSITRDTGDFGEALRHAREFVALDLRTRDYARWFLISKSACPLPQWPARELPPLWTN